MFYWLKNIFNKKEQAYLYFYTIGSDVYGSAEDIKTKISQVINQNITKEKYKISDYDIFTNKDLNESTIILTSHNIKTIAYRPLLFEIYAYTKKNKDLTVFANKFEEILFKYKIKDDNKLLTIFKFKF